MEHKPVFPATQKSLASEESQVNYDVLPFSSEDEIDSPLFNVNNNLYITAIEKKMTRIFMKKI